MKSTLSKDLYSLIHKASTMMGRGPRQGLSVRPGQNKVLKYLNKYGSMRQQDLLHELGIRAGTLSELLRKLEDDGYVQRHRNKNEGRELIVEITEKGRISALEHDLSVKERDEALFGSLNPEEKEQLIVLLNKLIAAWSIDDAVAEGVLREQRWKEIEQMQEEKREIDRLLEAAAAKGL